MSTVDLNETSGEIRDGCLIVRVSNIDNLAIDFVSAPNKQLQGWIIRASLPISCPL
jgi:hypothetical protein